MHSAPRTCHLRANTTAHHSCAAQHNWELRLAVEATAQLQERGSNHGLLAWEEIQIHKAKWLLLSMCHFHTVAKSENPKSNYDRLRPSTCNV